MTKQNKQKTRPGQMNDLERAVWSLMRTDDYTVTGQGEDWAELHYVHNSPPHPVIRIEVRQPEGDAASVSQIMRYEEGELSDEEIIALFQALVDSGTAWQLQGSYGRTAQALIEAGLVTAKEEK